MAIGTVKRKIIHAGCGGEIEVIAKQETTNNLFRCKKCGEYELRNPEEIK